MYKVLIFTEYTLMIVGYLFVHFQVFVFSALNIKN